MGMDPVTIGLGMSAASGLYGAFSGNKAQGKAQDQAQQNYLAQQQWMQQQQGQLNAHNTAMSSLIMPYLQKQGQPGGASSGFDQFLYGSGGAPGGQPTGSSFNSGQDGLMQMMNRGGPGYQDDPETTALLRRLGAGTQFGTGGAGDVLSGIATGKQPMFDPRLTSSLTNDATQGFTADPNAMAAMTRAAGGNTGYDTSQAFSALKGQTQMDLNDQISQMRGQAGSLGQRFGSSMQNNEAQLRARAAVGLNSNEAAVGQQSWENSQNRALQGASALFGNQNALLGLRQGAQGMLGQMSQADTAARAGAAGQMQNYALGQGTQALNAAGALTGINQNRNAFAQQNAQGQLGYAQLFGQMLGQRQAGQAQDQNYNLGLLGMLNGQQSYLPTGAPQQQTMQGQNQLPGAIGDLGNMAMLYPFLQQMMGGGGGMSTGGPGAGRFTPQPLVGNFPSTLNWRM